jgi:flagellin-like protein
MALTNNDEAVSPVIGVILMVAITVILAAVIAAFVFGMSGNVQKTKVVAATAQMTTTGGIDITYQGGQDDPSLSYITISAPNGSATFYTSSVQGSLTLCPSGGCNTVTDQKKPDVGAVMKLIPPSPTDWPGQKHIVVVGAFNDGANQVILDTMV